MQNPLWLLPRSMNFTCNGLFYLPWLPGHHFVGFMVRSVLELGRGSACEAYPIYIRGFSENLEQFHLGKIQSGSSGWICVVWGWEGGFMKWSQVPRGVGWSGLLGDGSCFYGRSTYLKRGSNCNNTEENINNTEWIIMNSQNLEDAFNPDKTPPPTK